MSLENTVVCIILHVSILAFLQVLEAKRQLLAAGGRPDERVARDPADVPGARCSHGLLQEQVLGPRRVNG